MGIIAFFELVAKFKEVVSLRWYTVGRQQFIRMKKKKKMMCESVCARGCVLCACARAKFGVHTVH